MFKANYDREMDAIRASADRLRGAARSPNLRLRRLIRDQTAQSGRNFSLLYQEFWLYAARNPEVREELTRIDDEGAQALAEILRAERERVGLEPLASPLQTARIVEICFAASANCVFSQPDVADDEFVEAAIAFVARGLGDPVD